MVRVHPPSFLSADTPQARTFVRYRSFRRTSDLLFIGLLPARWSVNKSADYFNYYEPVARNITAGNGLTALEGGPALTYPPGFPLFLAAALGTADLLGVPEELLIRIEIMTTVALTAILVYLIAERIFGWRIGLFVPSSGNLPAPALVNQAAGTADSYSHALYYSLSFFFCLISESRWTYRLSFLIGMPTGVLFAGELTPRAHHVRGRQEP